MTYSAVEISTKNVQKADKFGKESAKTKYLSNPKLNLVPGPLWGPGDISRLKGNLCFHKTIRLVSDCPDKKVLISSEGIFDPIYFQGQPFLKGASLKNRKCTECHSLWLWSRNYLSQGHQHRHRHRSKNYQRERHRLVSTGSKCAPSSKLRSFTFINLAS